MAHRGNEERDQQECALGNSMVRVRNSVDVRAVQRANALKDFCYLNGVNL